MTAVAPKPITSRPYPARHRPTGSALGRMVRTTDPKDIAILYLVTAFTFFMVGGAMALLIRAELARPGLQFRLRHPRRGGRVRLVRLHPTVRRRPLPRRGR